MHGFLVCVVQFNVCVALAKPGRRQPFQRLSFVDRCSFCAQRNPLIFSRHPAPLQARSELQDMYDGAVAEKGDLEAALEEAQVREAALPRRFRTCCASSLIGCSMRCSLAMVWFVTAIALHWSPIICPARRPFAICVAGGGRRAARARGAAGVREPAAVLHAGGIQSGSRHGAGPGGGAGRRAAGGGAGGGAADERQRGVAHSGGGDAGARAAEC